MDKEKTAVVTGSSKGIGYATARRLAELGYRVVVCSRSLSRATEAAKKIAGETGGKATGVETDFTSLEGVRLAAQGISATAESVDVLVNNAAILPQSLQKSSDGLELQFAVNYLAAFLLTHELLPNLNVTEGPARVVNVSSQVHSRIPMDFSLVRPDTESHYDRLDIYSMSKLALIYFSEEMGRRHDPENLTINSLHPGVISTDLLADYYGFNRMRKMLGKPRGDKATVGADPVVFLATDESVSRITGQYFHKHRSKTPSYPDADPVDVASDLWALSQQLCGFTDR